VTQSEFYRGVEQAQQAMRASSNDAHAKVAAVAARLDSLVANTTTSALRACRDGCAHCCRHPVGVTLPEALAIVATIAKLPAALRESLTARIRQSASNTAKLTWEQLGHLPCPLLEAERCLLYAVRPLPCRAFASLDATACATPSPLGIPIDSEAFLIGLGAVSALQAGGPEPRELRAALTALFSTVGPDADSAFGRARVSGT
jgi:Fe-S-cluster containining protein